MGNSANNPSGRTGIKNGRLQLQIDRNAVILTLIGTKGLVEARLTNQESLALANALEKAARLIESPFVGHLVSMNSIEIETPSERKDGAK